MTCRDEENLVEFDNIIYILAGFSNIVETDKTRLFSFHHPSKQTLTFFVFDAKEVSSHSPH